MRWLLVPIAVLYGFIVVSAYAHGSDPKVTFCHRTLSATTPYVQITVSDDAALKAHLRKHDADIIPPFTEDGVTYSLNWDERGQEIFAAGCHDIEPSPTPDPSPSPTETVSPSPTPSGTETPSPTPTPTHSSSPTPTPTPTVSSTPSPSPTPSPTISASPSPSPTSSGTSSPTPKPSRSQPATPSPSSSETSGPATTDNQNPFTGYRTWFWVGVGFVFAAVGLFIAWASRRYGHD